MGREDEEADSHWRIRLLQTVVVASEELFQSDEVAQTLTRLLTVDGNHIVVHPVTKEYKEYKSKKDKMLRDSVAIKQKNTITTKTVKT